MIRRFECGGAEYELDVKVELTTAPAGSAALLVVELHTVPRTPAHLRALVLPIRGGIQTAEKAQAIQKALENLLDLCLLDE